MTDPTDVTDDWLTLPELADRTGLEPGKIRNLVSDGRLVTVRRNGAQVVPATFVAGGELLKGLGGLVTVLHDAGFEAEESISWMLSVEESLGTSPVEALANGRRREVNRVAQGLG
ncbi:MAG: Rv2175c family DNA-binding protein [Streptosporangiales bacterium]